MFNHDLTFKELRNKASEFYDSIDKVDCPALKQKVVFGSDGFHHLRYNASRSERSKPVQRNKLSYLEEAVSILKKTTTLQEFRDFNEPAGLRDASGFRRMCVVSYYGFWAVISRRIRLKVIVKQIDGGQFSFWSIMPYWSEKIIGGKKEKIFGSDHLPHE